MASAGTVNTRNGGYTLRNYVKKQCHLIEYVFVGGYFVSGSGPMKREPMKPGASYI